MKTTKENKFRDDEIVSIYNPILKHPHSMHLKPKLNQLFSSVIPIYYAKILNIKEDEYLVPSSEKWKITMCAIIRTVFNEHQYKLALSKHEKNVNGFK